MIPPLAQQSCALLVALHSTRNEAAWSADLYAVDMLAESLHAEERYAARALVRALGRSFVSSGESAPQPDGEIERAVQIASAALWWCYRPADVAELADFLRAAKCIARAETVAQVLPKPARCLVRALLREVERAVEARLECVAGKAVGCAA